MKWKKCGGCCAGQMCDTEYHDPDYATFLNIRTGKYYCATCLFEEIEFDKQVGELYRSAQTCREYREHWCCITNKMINGRIGEKRCEK